MKYKLIAVDMDGTLLDSSNHISQKTIEAIHQSLQMGVLFTISTGRSIQGIEKYNHLLSLDFPVIAYNGSMIVSLRSREILYEKSLTASSVLEIIELGQKFETTMCIWSRQQLYVFEVNAEVKDYIKLSDVEPIIIADKNALALQGVTKILWYDNAKKIRMLEEEVREKLSDDATCCTSKPTFLEFFNSAASKANALKFLGGLYDISPEEMIAIGDGLNDLPMLQYADLGIAMANAQQDVKNRADFVTLSNDEDGIAFAIEKFVLTG